MNAFAYELRIDALISGLSDGMVIEDSAGKNGRSITLWRKGSKYFVCYSNDTAGLFGFAFKGSAYDVRNEALRLAGY